MKDNIKSMKIIVGFSVMLFITTATSGQELIMSQLGPKAGDAKEVIKEYKDFIIYKNDTLNLKDNRGLKNGEWIEYRKAFLETTNGSYKIIDSTNASYVIEMRGWYINGKKTGIWNSYYRNGKIKESIKYD